MNIKQYLSSGILEQYAFGLLSPTERSEVEANLQQYPELVEELHKIEFALEQYLNAQAVDPSVDFRTFLDEHLADIEPDPAPVSPKRSTDSGANTGGGIPPWLLGLTILAFAAAAWLFFDNQQKEEAYDQLLLEQTQLREDCDETNEVNRGLLLQLQTIRQSGNNLIQMRPTGVGTADAIAAIIYNPDTESSFLDVINLPPLSEDQQYQLWAIVENVGPQNMAVFDAPAEINSDLLEVPFFENVQAFAITIEPRGGSEQPTLDQMVVIGATG